MSCIAPKCRETREVGSLFCKVHLGAPSGKRGGWISAWRRAQVRSNSNVPLDASNVCRRLWIGGAPPFDRDLPDFDVLVLCAAELQPPKLGFLRDVVRVPISESQRLTPSELRQVLIAARRVARAITTKRRALITCDTGRNRSALVASLALGMVTRAPPEQLVSLMRERRHADALSNLYFVELIQRLSGGGRRH